MNFCFCAAYIESAGKEDPAQLDFLVEYFSVDGSFSNISACKNEGEGAACQDFKRVCDGGLCELNVCLVIINHVHLNLQCCAGQRKPKEKPGLAQDA